MAENKIIIRTDDIDGSEDAEAVAFGIGGVDYTIDLSEANRAKLDEALAPFIGHATKIKTARGRGRARTASTSPASNPDELKAIREWGRANGFTVNDRGRVSSELRQAYEASLVAKASSKPAKTKTKPETKDESKDTDAK